MPRRRLSFFWATIVAIAAFAGACQGVSSTLGDNGPAGSVALTLDLQPGVILNTVSYRITHDDFATIVGSVDVSAPGATISFLVAGIQPAPGYTVSLLARSTSGGTQCHGSARFDVAANDTSRVAVALQCIGDFPTGGVQVSTTINRCPIIASFSAAPTTTSVYGTIDLRSLATDLDPGTMLTYAWSSDVAADFLINYQSQNASCFCTSVGQRTITLRVSDGACTQSRSVVVVCNPPPDRPAWPANATELLLEHDTGFGRPGPCVPLDGRYRLTTIDRSFTWHVCRNPAPYGPDSSFVYQDGQRALSQAELDDLLAAARKATLGETPGSNLDPWIFTVTTPTSRDSYCTFEFPYMDCSADGYVKHFEPVIEAVQALAH